MRKYKAVVVDVKQAAKRGTAVLLGAVAVVFAVVMFNGFMPSESESIEISSVGSESGFGESLGRYMKSGAELIIKAVLGYLPTDGKSILCGSVPVYGEVSEKAEVFLGYFEGITEEPESISDEKAEEEKKDGSDIPEENRAEIKVIDASQKTAEGMSVAVGNETSYGIDINAMMSKTPKINMSLNGPKVLIVHTHATESYADDGAKFYDITASDRSEDTSQNVVAVGRKMKEVLEKNGIETIHDTALHDVPSFNGSYAHSLNAVTEYMTKYPSIQVVFDIHRDSVVYDDNTKAKMLTVADGKDAAQLMFVVGTDEKGLYNPEWRDNMNAAVRFQMAITERYPKLMRHINLRRERFNGHTSHASMIIEVGTSGNSLREALNSIEAASECIADYLNSL